MSRYLLRCASDGGVEVYDASTGDANDAKTVFGPASWETAEREARRLNGYSFLSSLPPTVCPDCTRYRRVLQEIARSSGERHVLRAANEALDTIGGPR